MAAWRQFARNGFVDDGSARRSVTDFVERLNIRTTGIDQAVKDLSGGNQQKVVVARNLSIGPRVLLLDDPTVGVDVGSSAKILMQTRTLASAGDGHRARLLGAGGAQWRGGSGARHPGRRHRAHP